MATRVFKLFHCCSPLTLSSIQLFPEYLSSRQKCLYHLTQASNFCTSNTHASIKKSVNVSKNLLTDKVELEKKAHYILLQEKGFTPIYKMQFAPAFAAVNKIKWHQLYFLIGCTPLLVLCASLDLCSISVPLAFVCVGGIFTSSLWIFGALFRRVVGAILASPDGETMCISFIDNKGQRQDDVFPTAELVPLSDLPCQKFTSSWWILLQRYSTKERDYDPYKLFIQNYTIPDKQKFLEVFGSEF